MMMLLLPATRQAEAQVGVSLNFFYDNIGGDGSWVELADYGYCYQPAVAVTNVRWRPYTDGYWAYTDVGWTWISYEDFGWATYHYGRWVRLRDRGWFWVPGREWGPAWVSWRTGGDYVGWAPLPPRGVDEFIYEGTPITGHVDIDFDIGPAYYNFVDVRYIGEPVLRERIVEPHMNVTYITNTVNVTNISYANSVVYNHGPDYNTLSQYSTRPIRRMTLEREANVDINAAAKSNSLTKVQGDKLVVAAPLSVEKPAAPVAPKAVKEKIAKPTVERGWSEIADQKAQTELKQKIKAEDPKNVPPPSIKTRDKAETAQGSPGAAPATGAPPAAAPTSAAGAPARPAATTAPKAIASPAMTPDRSKGKEKAPAGVSPMPTAGAPALMPSGKGKKETGKPAPGLAPSAPNLQGTTPAVAPNKPSEKRQGAPSSLATSPDGTPFREPPVRDKEAKKERQKAPELMPTQQQPNEPTGLRKPKNEPPAAPPNRQAPPDVQPKRPLPPERMTPPARQAPPQAPPPQAAQPPQQAPPPPRKQAPPQRMAPPAPGPAANAPARQAPPQQAPQQNRGQGKKGNQPAPTPPGQ